MVAPLVLQTQVISAGIINALVLWLANVNIPVQSQKTTRRVTSGDNAFLAVLKVAYFTSLTTTLDSVG